MKGTKIDGVPSIKVGVHHTYTFSESEGEVMEPYSPIYCATCYQRIVMTQETNEFGEITMHFYCPKHGEIMYLYGWDDR